MSLSSSSSSEEEVVTIYEELPPEPKPKVKYTCCSALARHQKHQFSGFDSAWCKEYTRLEAVRDDAGKVQGMICWDHGKPPWSRSGVWSKVMCMSFIKTSLACSVLFFELYIEYHHGIRGTLRSHKRHSQTMYNFKFSWGRMPPDTHRVFCTLFSAI